LALCRCDAREVERLASRLRRRAGIPSDSVVDAGELAQRLLGDDSIVVLERLAVGARLRRRPEGDYVIEIRDNLPDVNFCVGHEVAHWGLAVVARYSGPGPEEERLANALAAALLAPESVVRGVVSKFGAALEPVQPLARTVRISQTSSNIRISEVLRDERAVLTAKNGNVLHRADSRFPWNDLRTHWKGLSKARLRGGIDEGRTALMVI
jgi:hypothetical protein